MDWFQIFGIVMWLWHIIQSLENLVFPFVNGNSSRADLMVLLWIRRDDRRGSVHSAWCLVNVSK